MIFRRYILYILKKQASDRKDESALNIQVRGKEQFKTSRWAGGSTTEFYIWPQDGDYASRAFQVRVSSATVELEESPFTKLPGVKRTLMMLDGKIRLVHEGRGEQSLSPYETSVFMGDWDTTSYGKATDLNLMLKDGAVGNLFYFEVNAGEESVLQPQALEETGKQEKLLVYVISGQGEIAGAAVQAQSLAVVDDYQGQPCGVINRSEQPLRLAVCHIGV